MLSPMYSFGTQLAPVSIRSVRTSASHNQTPTANAIIQDPCTCAEHWKMHQGEACRVSYSEHNPPSQHYSTMHTMVPNYSTTAPSSPYRFTAPPGCLANTLDQPPMPSYHTNTYTRLSHYDPTPTMTLVSPTAPHIAKSHFVYEQHSNPTAQPSTVRIPYSKRHAFRDFLQHPGLSPQRFNREPNADGKKVWVAAPPPSVTPTAFPNQLMTLNSHFTPHETTPRREYAGEYPTPVSTTHHYYRGNANVVNPTLRYTSPAMRAPEFFHTAVTGAQHRFLPQA